MTDLPDSNVLVAFTTPTHVHHDLARAWFAARAEPFATCPITQGALVRVLLRGGARIHEVVQILEAITTDPRHEFWPDAMAYDAAILGRVTGHSGVTDAYLAALARHHDARLATFDRALAATYPGVTELIPADRRG